MQDASKPVKDVRQAVKRSGGRGAARRECGMDAPAEGGVAGAQLLVLNSDLDGSTELDRQIADSGGDRFAITSQDHHEVLWGNLGDGMQCVRQHAASAEGV